MAPRPVTEREDHAHDRMQGERGAGREVMGAKPVEGVVAGCADADSPRSETGEVPRGGNEGPVAGDSKRVVGSHAGESNNSKASCEHHAVSEEDSAPKSNLDFGQESAKSSRSTTPAGPSRASESVLGKRSHVDGRPPAKTHQAKKHTGSEAERSGRPRIERAAGKLAILDALSLLKDMQKEREAAQLPPGDSTSSHRSILGFNNRTIESYLIMSQVGLGAYGEVYKAVDRGSHRIVALKKILVHNAKEGYPLIALREIKIMQHLKHENILKLLEIVPSSLILKENELGAVYMVLEYMDNDMTGILENKNLALTEDHVRCYMKQILEGIFYIHKNNIIHRDLKAANILVSNDSRVKIGDWGLSRSWKSGRKYTTRVVTLWYRAPELLLGVAHYTPAIDMWAVGCIFGELLTKEAVLPGDKEMGQLKRIFDLCGTPTEESWPGVSQTPVFKETKFEETPSTIDARFSSRMKPLELDLFKRMLTLDPRKRISAKDALDHDYFWANAAPCHPKDLPKIAGDGLHEYELKMKRKMAREMAANRQATQKRREANARRGAHHGSGSNRNYRGHSHRHRSGNHSHSDRGGHGLYKNMTFSRNPSTTSHQGRARSSSTEHKSAKYQH